MIVAFWHLCVLICPPAPLNHALSVLVSGCLRLSNSSIDGFVLEFSSFLQLLRVDFLPLEAWDVLVTVVRGQGFECTSIYEIAFQ
jgi:hypothetical protein